MVTVTNWRWMIVTLLLMTGLTAAQQGRVSWQVTREKMLSEAYRMHYDYEGPEGKYLFRYTVQGDGEKILTEVLGGSARGKGTRILYEPARDKDNVFMETRFLTLRRSLTARDIKDSSLYQPLFRQLVNELVVEKPSEILQVGDGLMFVFGSSDGSQDRIQVDSEGNPVSFRHLESGKETKSIKFRDIKWGHHTIDWPES